MMKMEMLYAVFVKLNGNTDNSRLMEVLEFNTKYMQYTLMTNYIQKAEKLVEKLEKQIDELNDMSYKQGQIDLLNHIQEMSKQGHDVQEMMNNLFDIIKVLEKDLIPKKSN
mgnify:CR=1 FL=1